MTVTLVLCSTPGVDIHLFGMATPDEVSLPTEYSTFVEHDKINGMHYSMHIQVMCARAPPM